MLCCYHERMPVGMFQLWTAPAVYHERVVLLAVAIQEPSLQLWSDWVISLISAAAGSVLTVQQVRFNFLRWKGVY